ncbi:hypothetical protein DN824_08740 [Stutzerimonas nosocomialis]|uniref:hypothetical protein n=1 Tax=Stutzerimonas nosocomialis TaxID=1056496 RepID=UPI00110975B5|nr:hypothetical protein [Stutzerimonas nosocomialis]TLX59180.1 hypothetical protein DN824_08740 [Stutzerimonas nosocomialis]
MPHANDIRRLKELGQQLEQAMQLDDWSLISEADQAIAQCLKALGERLHPSDELMRARAELQQSHARALKRCAEECERLRQLLENCVEHAEGRAAYQRIGLYAVGDQP